MESKYIPKIGSKNFPGDFEYLYDDKTNLAAIKIAQKDSSYKLRKLDCWGLAYVNFLNEFANANADGIQYHLEYFNEDKKAEIEALKRRISFLAINNPDMVISLLIEGNEIELYGLDTLFNRPKTEIIRDGNIERDSGDAPGRLEKDLQAFIYHDGAIKNRRLAYFGEDFTDLTKDKSLGILREFPTGVFQTEVRESTRIMPTNYIDFVSFNKWKELTLIELKVDDSSLEVISQLLDYALFFTTYKSQLLPTLRTLFKGEYPETEKPKIACYVVNNRFHPRFASLMKYYDTKGKGYGFEMKQVILGQTNELQ